ncbi:Panacea domain-containing protein [Brachyspira murdochii]|uniref:Antitoxin SocA-like Panacea domain-containing protein n=1 Tax=Brachyspira murdochii TaxID=84378 RepID=A0ABX5BAE4_9SPIR|nr:type II toxin-antitoxin system antitoxin SocA domain-containing protein [Brachyspira murdochii]PPS23147.1 hypothetical protein DJ52_00765 [Brachyspira murdochii]
MQFKSIEIAAYIYNRCINKNFSGINNTKIQKLLYCCYGSVLAANSDRLCDEYPRAWNYGPVFPKVFKFINKKGIENLSEVGIPNIPDDIKNIMDITIDFFGKFSSTQLSNWSHEEGSPWHSVIVLQKNKYGAFIPDDSIKDYFEHYVITK